MVALSGEALPDIAANAGPSADNETNRFHGQTVQQTATDEVLEMRYQIG